MVRGKALLATCQPGQPCPPLEVLRYGQEEDGGGGGGCEEEDGCCEEEEEEEEDGGCRADKDGRTWEEY